MEVQRETGHCLGLGLRCCSSATPSATWTVLLPPPGIGSDALALFEQAGAAEAADVRLLLAPLR